MKSRPSMWVYFKARISGFDTIKTTYGKEYIFKDRVLLRCFILAIMGILPILARMINYTSIEISKMISLVLLVIDLIAIMPIVYLTTRFNEIKQKER